jgi:hypothetical protein
MVSASRMHPSDWRATAASAAGSASIFSLRAISSSLPAISRA